LSPPRLLHGERRVQVRPHENRLAIEHLLEVRQEPLLVDAVAGDPAAQVVVHAA